MDKLKERYDIIIGFIAIIISLSVFKNELDRIILDLDFCKFSISQYLFFSIVGFVVCIYLLLISYLSRITKYSHFKIFNVIESISYVGFILILLGM